MTILDVRNAESITRVKFADDFKGVDNGLMLSVEATGFCELLDGTAKGTSLFCVSDIDNMILALKQVKALMGK